MDLQGEQWVQMVHEIAAVVPKEVVVMSDQEVVIELEEEATVMEMLRATHGLFHWGRQSITINSLVAQKDLVVDFVQEWGLNREKQKNLEHQHHRMREDQQECQQQMINPGEGK